MFACKSRETAIGISGEISLCIVSKISPSISKTSSATIAPCNDNKTPSSGSDAFKTLIKLFFSSLINLILSGHNNVSVFLVGSQAENELCEEIKQNSDDKINIHNLAGKTSIKELLELLSRADLTITNCNGVSHLACTTNSPIIGLYGPTDYRITGPKSSSFIPVTAGLECAPCYAKDYITGCGNPICMEAIKVQDVIKLVNGLL